MELKNLAQPGFVDPLYLQYQKPPGECTRRFPLTAVTPYPMVDPARMRLGWGQKFRSQYRGICPLGFMGGANNMCYPTVEQTSLFYKVPHLEYKDQKIATDEYKIPPCFPGSPYKPW